MTCDTAQALISAAFDGESAADATDHVAHCPRCAAFAATAQEVRRQIRFEPVEQPVDVVASVTDTITQTGRRSLARWGWWLPASPSGLCSRQRLYGSRIAPPQLHSPPRSSSRCRRLKPPSMLSMPP